jgi:hypothetical protein
LRVPKFPGVDEEVVLVVGRLAYQVGKLTKDLPLFLPS